MTWLESRILNPSQHVGIRPTNILMESTTKNLYTCQQFGCFSIQTVKATDSSPHDHLAASLWSHRKQRCINVKTCFGRTPLEISTRERRRSQNPPVCYFTIAFLIIQQTLAPPRLEAHNSRDVQRLHSVHMLEQFSNAVNHSVVHLLNRSSLRPSRNLHQLKP